MEKKGNFNKGNEENKVFRLRIPKPGEVVGLIDQRVGGSRMLVKCSDGKTRNCKVPGRLRRALWIREGDYVIVHPWEFDDTKGDIMYKYHQNDFSSLREKGYVKEIESSL
ncbi:MAG TPA: translation initiation factor eIF-1A [Candidatus Nanoarchaeia archaeon]|nr:translation initiation factor eIF-1A [Candidatus Nanoarchaeia archaeon]